MNKEKSSLFSLPSCTIQPVGGITISDSIAMPIPKWEIKDEWITGWENFESMIKEKFYLAFERKTGHEAIDVIDTTSKLRFKIKKMMSCWEAD